MKCDHYKGDGFHYLDWKLLLCNKCDKKLRAEVVEQINLEKKFYNCKNIGRKFKEVKK